MSSVYKNQLCGLCGNFDGQMTKEMEGPQRTIFMATDDFFKSYVIPDPQCPAHMLPAKQPVAKLMPVNQPVASTTRYMARPQMPESKQPEVVDMEDDFGHEFAE